ncbi:MAG: polynucleotide adenylyltransferase PcnB [Pseudomonadales bacterium]|nr:polynucleotide adenylyltransferase PcnB [Pseudomonadales bacterium]
MNSNLELPGLDKATVISRDNHSISRKQISPNALKVLYRLSDADFHAYIVGGGVRDILLGNKPKDFDVATDATPEEVRKLFKNARIIGRRFKIVHIRFGREIIEVTTFRANHNPENEIADHVPRRQIKGLDSAHSKSGMILRDNVYGDIDEDALRRDFTINALYYTTRNFELLDFCGGLDDLAKKQIRIIGDPEERYKEDPVRMLRAIRFSAKLNFDIEANTKKPLNDLAYLLDSISPARLFDETLKLMTGGCAQRTFALLCEYQLGSYLFAPSMEAIEQGDSISAKLVDLALRNTDQRLAENKSVTPAFLFAALLWPVLKLHLAASRNQDIHPQQAFQQATQAALTEQLDYTAIPKRFTVASREIWELQNRLQRQNRRSIESVFNHPRFRAAYDFLLLREEAGEELGGLGQWWTDFQNGDTKLRTELIAAVSKPKKRRRRRSKRKSPGVSE